MVLDASTVIIVIMAVFAAVVGLGMVSAIVSDTVNYSSIVETLGTADGSGYLAATLSHTPSSTPSITCT